MTLGGLVGVATAPFAGAVVDASRNKRVLVAAGTAAVAAGALLISLGARRLPVAAAEVLQERPANRTA